MGVTIDAATGTTDAMSFDGSVNEKPSKTMAMPVFCSPVSIDIATRSTVGKPSTNEKIRPIRKPLQTVIAVESRIFAFINLNIYKFAYVPNVMIKIIIPIEIGANHFLQTYPIII